MSLLECAVQLPGAYLGAHLQHSINFYTYACNLSEYHKGLLRQLLIERDEEVSVEIENELPPLPESTAIDAILERYQPLVDDIVMRQRNSIAAKAALRAATSSPDSPITLLWGEYHLEGIGDELCRGGYAP